MVHVTLDSTSLYVVTSLLYAFIAHLFGCASGAKKIDYDNYDLLSFQPPLLRFANQIKIESLLTK